MAAALREAGVEAEKFLPGGVVGAEEEVSFDQARVLFFQVGGLRLRGGELLLKVGELGFELLVLGGELGTVFTNGLKRLPVWVTLA